MIDDDDDDELVVVVDVGSEVQEEDADDDDGAWKGLLLFRIVIGEPVKVVDPGRSASANATLHFEVV